MKKAILVFLTVLVMTVGYTFVVSAADAAPVVSQTSSEQPIVSAANKELKQLIDEIISKTQTITGLFNRKDEEFASNVQSYIVSIKEKDSKIASLTADATSKDEKIASLSADIAAKDNDINALKAADAKKNSDLAKANKALSTARLQTYIVGGGLALALVLVLVLK